MADYALYQILKIVWYIITGTAFVVLLYQIYAGFFPSKKNIFFHQKIGWIILLILILIHGILAFLLFNIV